MRKIAILTGIIIILAFSFLNNDNILKLFYKTQYSEYVEKYSQEYGIDKYLIYSIIKAESNFNPNANSDKGACGLMQLMEKTAEEVAQNEIIEYSSNETLYDAEKNIQLGIKYYADLKEQCGNDKIALAAYNAGIGNVQKWIKDGIIKEDGSDIENIPYKETNIYVRKILNNYTMYKRLYF